MYLSVVGVNLWHRKAILVLWEGEYIPVEMGSFPGPQERNEY